MSPAKICIETVNFDKKIWLQHQELLMGLIVYSFKPNYGLHSKKWEFIWLLEVIRFPEFIEKDSFIWLEVEVTSILERNVLQCGFWN